MRTKSRLAARASNFHCLAGAGAIETEIKTALETHLFFQRRTRGRHWTLTLNDFTETLSTASQFDGFRMKTLHCSFPFSKSQVTSLDKNALEAPKTRNCFFRRAALAFRVRSSLAAKYLVREATARSGG